VSARTRYDRTKRVLDIVGASIGLVATAPLQLAVATAVALRLGRPVLFGQARPGKDGRLFLIRKFRSMRMSRPGTSESDSERMTGLGRVIRATSLDELPTLWNVLRGEMSFVGPRPLLPEYLGRYTSEQARRHEVRPGITGLAQASGRNSLSWERKLALDVEYVDSRSFTTDVRVLWMTVRIVVTRNGINAEGHTTMHEFRGTTHVDTPTS
jgi:lipopolysaccharide/colanic/teichoic acid biosynthesis glycosyltransferase